MRHRDKGAKVMLQRKTALSTTGAGTIEYLYAKKKRGGWILIHVLYNVRKLCLPYNKINESCNTDLSVNVKAIKL